MQKIDEDSRRRRADSERVAGGWPTSDHRTDAMIGVARELAQELEEMEQIAEDMERSEDCVWVEEESDAVV